MRAATERPAPRTVSVVTVVRNGEQTIAGCLESVARQTVPAQHVVVDGASTDRTLEVVGRYAHVSTVTSEPDSGLYDAMNKGIRASTGDVVGILNADDLYAGPDVLESVVDALESTGADTCYGDLEYVDAADPRQVVRSWTSGAYSAGRMRWGWMPPHPTFFVKRAVYDRCGLFDLSLGTAADYELMLRFLLRDGVTTTYLPRVLVRMRTGGSSGRTLSARLRAHANDWRAWSRNGLSTFPWRVVFKPLRKVGQFRRVTARGGAG